ncbi:SRPBCC family protein, partial [Kribbella sp.]|uniref:SRPBCC family protein n=1 Tax=Kribbella sp. TaxID=1871183 RepID=UPI002D4BC773
MDNLPRDVDRTAPVVAGHELSISAPAAVVWELLTAVSSWTSWQPDIVAARGPVPLTAGATFHWETAGFDIASTVYVADAPRLLRWGGPTQGITAVHEWVLTPTGPGTTLVVTEESWDGEVVRADAVNIQQALGESLVQWLGHLKSAA